MYFWSIERRINSISPFLLLAFCLSLGGCIKASIIDDKDIYANLVFDGNKPPSLDDSTFVWPYGKTKAVCFTWDDGIKRHTQSLVDLFDKYKLRTTFYVITSNLNVKSLYLEYVSALLSGHEVSSHTVDHLALTELEENEIDYQLRQSSEDIMLAFGYAPTTFAHPNRKMNSLVDSLIHKYYLASRTSSIDKYPGRIVHSILNTDTFDSLSGEFKSFIQNNKTNLIVYSGHGLSSSYLDVVHTFEPVDSTVFDSFLAFIIKGYMDDVFVAPYEDIVLSKVIREKIQLKYGKDFIFIDTGEINPILEKYSHPKALFSLVFSSSQISFHSTAIEDLKIVNNNTIVTIDLRKGSVLYYE